MNCLSLVLLLLVGGRFSNAVAQTDAQVPTGWVVVEPPQAGSEELDCANWYRTDWGVRLGPDSQALVIDSVPRMASPDLELVLPDGFLRGVDHGEFGGGIYFHQAGDSSPRTISSQNAHGFIRSGTQVFALVGLAHLSLDHGQILQLQPGFGGHWRATPTLDLGSSPQAFLQLDSLTVLVVTSGQLLRVELPDRQTLLHRSDAWPYVSPATSIVRDRHRNLFVGFRYAVAWLQPDGSGYRERWLVPSSCPHQRRSSNYECKCQR